MLKGGAVFGRQGIQELDTGIIMKSSRWMRSCSATKGLDVKRSFELMVSYDKALDADEVLEDKRIGVF